jgi:hypothetical protein
MMTGVPGGGCPVGVASLCTKTEFVALPDQSVISWLGTFLSSLFSPTNMAKTTYHSIVDAGGCDKLMLATIMGDMNPLPSGGPGPTDVAAVAPKAVLGIGGGAAIGYGVSQGLTVPMRSSIYRALSVSTKGAADVAEKFALPAQIVGSAAHGMINAGIGASNGTCH